uniref:ATP synthase complex subunit 8 n=1 Tax=Aspasma minima TaxID=181476 RepID=Q8HKQ7_ASPMI|nr:ATP synthase F0 subunit 8 [Aspasma minima]BAC23791.1 ATPase subunit 8 [Aspasma minima]
MPQLDPTPWLITLLFSWFTLLTIVPLKLLPHLVPNEFTRKDTNKLKNTTWTWPWQ